MPMKFEEALEVIFENCPQVGSEQVPLLSARGRVLAQDMYASWDMPLWNNSAMDGFAVRAQDCVDGASLKITGFIPAGALPEPAVEPGCAVRIMTGAPVPSGCDAVVPYEQTRETDGLVTVEGPVEVRDHIRFQGEDVTKGEKVLPCGTLLRSSEISMLTAFSQPLVSVFRRPRVAILSTGDELVETGQQPGPGQIVNCNSHALAALVEEAGATSVLLGIARDNRESLEEKLRMALDADVLLTSAGVSAGDRDLVREILAELGAEEKFWKVEIKPGRPIAFSRNGDTLIFSLPGNPVSAMVTFDQFVRPALLKMQGHQRLRRQRLTAIVRNPIRKKPGRLNFIRVALSYENGQWVAESAGDQNSGILKTMVRANGLAILPLESAGADAGDHLEVEITDPFALMQN